VPETDQARTRDDVIRRLADACAQVGIAFDRGAGRCGDLVGVLSDAIERPGTGLGHEDRWAIAIRISTPARRFARTIATSGPYADVPQLLSVADRSRELVHIAALDPPQLGLVGALDQPISMPSRGVDARMAKVAEATALLLGEFRRVGRDPMTSRELVAIAHASSRVAGHAELLGMTPEDDTSATCAWQSARDMVARYSDGMPVARTEFAHSRVIDAALNSAVTRAGRSLELTCDGATAQALKHARIGFLLERMAICCAVEFERIGVRLVVSGGQRPLHEDRVGEWLRHEPFGARPPDLLPAIEALRAAGTASRQMSTTKSLDMSRAEFVM
jgi:hypothetical protein